MTHREEAGEWRNYQLNGTTIATERSSLGWQNGAKFNFIVYEVIYGTCVCEQLQYTTHSLLLLPPSPPVAVRTQGVGFEDELDLVTRDTICNRRPITTSSGGVTLRTHVWPFGGCVCMCDVTDDKWIKYAGRFCNWLSLYRLQGDGFPGRLRTRATHTHLRAGECQKPIEMSIERQPDDCFAFD